VILTDCVRPTPTRVGLGVEEERAADPVSANKNDAPLAHTATDINANRIPVNKLLPELRIVVSFDRDLFVCYRKVLVPIRTVNALKVVGVASR